MCVWLIQDTAKHGSDGRWTDFEGKAKLSSTCRQLCTSTMIGLTVRDEKNVDSLCGLCSTDVAGRIPYLHHDVSISEVLSSSKYERERAFLPTIASAFKNSLLDMVLLNYVANKPSLKDNTKRG